MKSKKTQLLKSVLINEFKKMHSLHISQMDSEMNTPANTIDLNNSGSESLSASGSLISIADSFKKSRSLESVCLELTALKEAIGERDKTIKFLTEIINDKKQEIDRIIADKDRITEERDKYMEKVDKCMEKIDNLYSLLIQKK